MDPYIFKLSKGVIVLKAISLLRSLLYLNLIENRLLRLLLLCVNLIGSEILPGIIKEAEPSVMLLNIIYTPYYKEREGFIEEPLHL